MPKKTDITRECSICEITYPETFFRTYKYKQEVRRLKHCKFCVVKRKPFEDRISSWLSDQRSDRTEKELSERYSGTRVFD